jgi:hypothetical protein
MGLNLKALENKVIKTTSIQGVDVELRINKHGKNPGLLDIEITAPNKEKATIPAIQIGLKPEDVNQIFIYDGVLALFYQDKKVFYKILTFPVNKNGHKYHLEVIALTPREIINAIGDTIRPSYVHKNGIIYGPEYFEIKDAAKGILYFEINLHEHPSLPIYVDMRKMASYLSEYSNGPRILVVSNDSRLEGQNRDDESRSLFPQGFQSSENMNISGVRPWIVKDTPVVNLYEFLEAGADI